jgi:hypothetical protein
MQSQPPMTTFCGVNAHFQNGIAERVIGDLLESARKQLLDARACWPAVVHFALWPYALRNAALLHNSLPVLEDGTSRLDIQLNLSRVQYEACAHFHGPSVCVTKCISLRQIPTQMVSMHQIRSQSRTQSYPCKECLPGIQFDDCVHISTIPLSV